MKWLEAGTLVGPNLRLVRPLAAGGMGSVWTAEHAALRTEVAVKFLVGVAADHPVATRFEQEAPTTARIKSPHVVQIFDHGITPEGVPFIVMELLHGETLGSRLQRVGSLSLLETAAIVVQTSRCLTMAHAVQVVHRDIKPDNLFLTDSAGDLFVKILDFGIAKNSADSALSMTQSGATMGTPSYMSPEQFTSARAVTPAADLWSVAVVAYVCLTGVLPFRAETYGGMAIAISQGCFEPPTQVSPGLAPALDGWFERALAVDPNRRFSSAKELADLFVVAAGVSFADLASVASGMPATHSPGVNEHQLGDTSPIPVPSPMEISPRSWNRRSLTADLPKEREVAAAHATRELAMAPVPQVSIAGTVTSGQSRESKKTNTRLFAAIGVGLVLASGAMALISKNQPETEPTVVLLPPPVESNPPAAASAEAAPSNAPPPANDVAPVGEPTSKATVSPATISSKATLPTPQPRRAPAPPRSQRKDYGF